MEARVLPIHKGPRLQQHLATLAQADRVDEGFGIDSGKEQVIQVYLVLLEFTVGGFPGIGAHQFLQRIVRDEGHRHETGVGHHVLDAGPGLLEYLQVGVANPGIEGVRHAVVDDDRDNREGEDEKEHQADGHLAAQALVPELCLE